MTKAERTIKEIDRMLQEHCSGYLLICFHPQTGEPMLAVSPEDDPKTDLALGALASSILAQGGAGFVRGQIEASKKEQEEE